MSLGINPGALKAANETLEQFVTAEPDFYDTPQNRKVLQDFLRGVKQGELQGDVIPIEL